MARHSKGSSARPFVTYHEKALLARAGARPRLGRDALRDGDACFLCLARAVEPVCCAQGHLACRECILESVLAQKRAHRAKTARFRQQQRDDDAAAAAAALADASEREQAFVEAQTGWGGSLSHSRDRSRSPPRIQSSDAHLPSYWLPSKTPSTAPARVPSPPRTERAVAQCLAVDGGHPLGPVRNLVTVRAVADAADPTLTACPSCRRSLGNNTGRSVLRACGHVLCTLCATALRAAATEPDAALACPHCAVSSRVVISLHSEGTGFAARGGNI